MTFGFDTALENDKIMKDRGISREKRMECRGYSIGPCNIINGNRDKMDDTICEVLSLGLEGSTATNYIERQLTGLRKDR